MREDCSPAVRLLRRSAAPKEALELSPGTLQRFFRPSSNNQSSGNGSSLLDLVHLLHFGIDILLTKSLPLEHGLALGPAYILDPTTAPATAAVHLLLALVVFEVARFALAVLPRELDRRAVRDAGIVPNRQVVLSYLEVGEGDGAFGLGVFVGIASLEA